MLQSIISLAGYFSVKIIQFMLRFLPYRRISDAGALAGNFFEIIGTRKKVAIENIRQSNLALDSSQAANLIGRSYSYFGRTFFELLALDKIRLREDRDFELIVPDRFYQNIEKGAIFISAHIGNWELMGKVLAEHQVPMAVVVKRQQNGRVDRLVTFVRERSGMIVVYDDEAVRLRGLIEKKYCIALLSDQDFGGNAVPVNFLGRPCFAAEGPVFLAKKFKIPVFMCFAVRQDDYFHRFEIMPFEYDMALGSESLVQAYTNEIEKVVSKHPAQWLWHHRRWKVHA